MLVFSLHSLNVVMFSFGCSAPVKRLAGKIISEKSYNVWSGTLNLTQHKS